MNVGLLAGPLVGAVIGYCTNYIAVKMLFRPLEPVKIFGKTLPFTPGIIPKGKERIAKTVGAAVGENLLTEEALEKNLLSEELKSNLKNKVNEKLKYMQKDERLINEVVTSYIDEDELEKGLNTIETFAAEKLCIKLMEMDIGKLVADEAIESIKESTVGSIIGRFLSDELLYSLLMPISERVDGLVKEKGADLIKEKIHGEVESFQGKTLGETMKNLENLNIDIGAAVVRCYELLIKKKLSNILKEINVSQIIQTKINEMDVKEVEEMTLSVMKKELNAVVNLGAVIGFVLGCINILFNM